MNIETVAKNPKIWIAVIIAIVVVWSLGGDDEESDYFSGWGTTVSGYLYSVNESWLRQANRMHIDDDDVALGKMIDAGKVSLLPPGIEVKFVQHSAGLVKVRAKGYTKEIWTKRKAIKAD